MKVQLIRPPLDDWYKDQHLKRYMSIPSWLCQVSSSVKNIPNVEVEVIEGYYSSLDEIKKNIHADLVGVSDIYSSHKNSIELLQYAKNKGAKTIIAGPNINPMPERIIHNYSFIDFAGVKDGEIILPGLVKGDIENTPNIYYRKNGEVVHNNIRETDLNQIYDLEDLTDKSLLDQNQSLSISTIRGCIKAEKYDRCGFCSLDHSLKIMKAELVWEQLRLFKEKYEINKVMDAGDSFMVGKRPEILLNKRPKDLEDIRFTRIYASPDQLNEKQMMILKDLNIDSIFLGIESYNDDILKKAGKQYTTKDIETTINLANKYNIDLHVPFMFGLEGENSKTLEKTFQYAKKVMEKNPDTMILSSHAIPLIGSPYFNNLMNHPQAAKEYSGDIENDDFLKYNELIRLHIKYFTNTTYEECHNYLNNTLSLAKEGKKTSFDAND